MTEQKRRSRLTECPDCESPIYRERRRWYEKPFYGEAYMCKCCNKKIYRSRWSRYRAARVALAKQPEA